MNSTTHYDQHAPQLSSQYESLAFESVHAGLLDLLPSAGGLVLDVGAGSGRDAAWLAARGYQVIAVEPAGAMRELARATHPSPAIRWIDDSLPDLLQVSRLGLSFDFILLSAVWMHVAPAQRARALRKLATMLAPNGRIAISLRLGEPDKQRVMHPVSLAELTALARQFGLQVVHTDDSDDRLGRAAVSWCTVVLGLPDEGLGTLPLLRHLVLVDGKSSTYKIALLRIAARIADTASGCARHGPDHVTIPMGLVALFWMRMYKPLIENGLPQMPLGQRPAFANDSFHALKMIHPVELRAGVTFHGDTARHLHRSLGDIARLIRDMPARYLTWPASDKPIFPVSVSRRQSAGAQVTIDEAYLWSFGEFQIPMEIWQTLTRYNVWIEPVLVTEWARLIEGYAGTTRKDVRQLAPALLAWADPDRDTRIAKAAVARIAAAGTPLYCVWSGTRLTASIHIDHCFPYAAWPCGDAWNLMPASARVNGEKSNRLVTRHALEQASERIEEWWTNAFLTADAHAHAAFFQEAAQTLPLLIERPRASDVIEAMQTHRLRLAKDQGLRPWEPTRPARAVGAALTQG